MLGGYYKVSPGFTVVEITVVLAIMSALVILAFIGQGQIRANARFTDTVDRTVSALSKAQNDANTTVNFDTDLSRGKRINEVFFGVSMVAASPTSFSFTPLYFQERPETCGSSCILQPKSALTETFISPHGATLTPSHNIVFARSPSSGRNITYVLPLSANLNTYSSFSPSAVPAKITVSDGRGNNACITVESRSGVISKAYGAVC